MKIIEEFKKFALRGNMVDLAVGFTVGAAFTTVVKSIVDDIIMPPIGMLLGDVDFSDRFFVLELPDGKTMPEGGFDTLEAATQFGAVTLNYGRFFNNCLSLLIIALAMFVIIRFINRLDEQLDEAFADPPKEPDEPADKKCEYCRTTIAFRAIRCPNCTSDLAFGDGDNTATDVGEPKLA